MVDLGVDAAQSDGLTVGEGVHGIEANVQAAGGVVDGKDVDLLAVVLKAVAAAAVGGVPAGNDVHTANVGELGDVALLLPAVLGDEAVGAVRAGNGSHGARGVIVASVVRDGGGRGSSGQGEGAEETGELHVCGVVVVGGGGVCKRLFRSE